MEKLFDVVDSMKPIYDRFYKFIMFLCKMLLIIDILITVMAVTGRYVSFVPDPSWTEEVVLTCIAYMAVLSAALAIRNRSHIRMTAFDDVLPKKLVIISDIVGDIAVLGLAIIMIVVGWKYAIQIGARASYVSLPNVSRFWKYFPIPLAGIVMFVFQIEVLLNDFKRLLIKEEKV